ncbi:hypothetical protein DICVIV_03579 [Dictyocaulus viviparus]|uniref:Uncharacterized protein n=1 Tax=Dictyocaulus viviparus TaxID=29172 RepID=A0A0D8Y6U3_DICVI|nr:hypothetical protein DICVIV_03579 [Dictyocaulus viviparus]
MKWYRKRAVNFRMTVGYWTGFAGLLVATLVLLHDVQAYSKNFVNSSMPEMRPTFVVNFDMATVICQHSWLYTINAKDPIYV